ncbi:response regulator [Coriobacteriaceae bacterium CHKCI002]|nr:response regulator [Coriobacteriaceae bacterium CHKCI002]
MTKLSLASFLVGFANEATRTLYVQMGVANSSGASYAFIQAIAAFVATSGIVAIALALLGSKTEHMAKNAYHALVVLLMAGTLLLPLPLVYPHVSVHIPYAVNAASYTCFGMFMWIIVAGVCGRYRHAKVRTFGIVRAAWALGPLLGLLLGRFVLHRAGLSVETAFPVMLLAAAVLLLASNAVFTESDLVKAMDIIPLARKRRFRAKCMRVIERYGLSEREGEIMIMLAKGRNLPYVQEHLYLSRSTVSTHRQHIYQKLEIHSQQELMNLVERAEE